jgi:hypothetical protein
MPNWCNNVLEIGHEDPALLERAKDALNRGEFLSEFIPVPEDLSIVAGRVGADEDQKQKDLVAQEEVNLAKHGYRNWYDFCVNEWGTKWDVGGDGMTCEIENGRISTSFDSAWAPPCAAMDKLMDMGFSVRLYYYESGMCFAGIYDENGDDFYELGGMSSVEVADGIPSYLDDMFGISECIAEYEAENAEEEELHTWVTEGAEAKKANNE